MTERKKANPLVIDVLIFGGVLIVMLLGWRDMQPAKQPVQAEYASLQQGERYTVKPGNILTGLKTSGIKFERRRTNDPYSTINLSKAGVTVQLKLPHCYYPNGTGGQIELPRVVQMGETSYHERNFGDVKLPAEWGGEVIHVIDHLADGDTTDGTLSFITYTVKPPPQH